MIEVDFTKVSIQATVEGDPIVVDLKKEVGNLIYSRATDVALSDLGKDVYYKGKVKVDDALVHPLVELISLSGLIYPVKKSLFDLLTIKEKKNGTKKINAD